MSSSLYLDSSALVKFVLPETEALVELLSGWPDQISGALARVGVIRTVRRVYGAACARAENAAARLEPSELRPFHAIHLATALSVGDDLGRMVSYDARLAQAAGRNGVPTLSPGVEGEQ